MFDKFLFYEIQSKGFINIALKLKNFVIVFNPDEKEGCIVCVTSGLPIGWIDYDAVSCLEDDVRNGSCDNVWKY